MNKPAHNEHLFIEEIEKGYLKIDNKGKIWRIARKFGNSFVKRKNIKITKRELNYVGERGYIQISLNIKGKIYHCQAHRLVWIFFNGFIPDDKEINHKNGIKTDNRLENLELVTASENTKHAVKFGLNNTKGEKSPLAKLTDDDVKEIRERYINKETQSSIAKDFNVGLNNISKIVNRQRWAHVQ